MLNRRHLRVKVMQALYAYSLTEDKSIKDFENALFRSIEEVDHMYIWTLNLLDEVAEYVVIDSEERAKKWLPSDKDKFLSSTKLNNNAFIESLRQNRVYVEKVKKYKVDWSFDPEIVRSVYAQLKASETYTAYLQDEDRSIAKEKDIIKYVFKKIILKTPNIEQSLEARFIDWSVDKEVLQAMIAKTFKNFSSDNPAQNKLADLTPSWAEDQEYVQELLSKAIRYQKEYAVLVGDKTKNWESDRIALMDSLLMQMAITELLHFPTIPVKVTMNEYIEISKDYSTAKSSTFINGILDKILSDLKQQGRIRKEGRGLQG
ncbi:transcription antitermination factor NusB [Sphingobacterium sp. lm-10]|uniref:transcription antitermination factor NusB n=1 Tax=Sphingobacterium sp. lm-10 TaxID=2944904 RepID=UPI0020213F42|nr:transcription antitermination factor NusB [Sphingobacterium sp. lm-10]MCL7986457.1 transcription antitermination factor NusB [Sphingobacterium sp. lm-10]